MAAGPGSGTGETVSLLSGQAVVWTAPGLTELVRVEVPRAGGGEVTVAVLTSIVSTGTERAQYLSLPNTSVGFPHRPGYSAAGVVLATGRDVSSVRSAELVAVRNVPHMSVVTVPASSAILSRQESARKPPQSCSSESFARRASGVPASRRETLFALSAPA